MTKRVAISVVGSLVVLIVGLIAYMNYDPLWPLKPVGPIPKPAFQVGDCIVLPDMHYDWWQPPMDEKYIIANVGDRSYRLYDFKHDINLDTPIVLRFSTATEFKKVECNADWN